MCRPTECKYSSPALCTVSTTRNTKHWIMLWSTREDYTGRVSSSTCWRSDRRQRLPAKACKFCTGSTKPVNSVKPNHQASKDVCSHLMSPLKDWTTFETAKHTRTMAAAIRASKDCLNEQELKRISEPIPTATKSIILRSQETGKPH